MPENDVTKCFGVELREATRQLVNDAVPAPMMAWLADLAAEESSDHFGPDASARDEASPYR